MRKCNCHSYNGQFGNIPEVIVTVPEQLFTMPDGRKTVCIDACIVKEVLELWTGGFPTLNSCCGHGKLPPSLIVQEGIEPARYLAALAEIDPERDWVISRWELVDYTRHQSMGRMDVPAEPTEAMLVAGLNEADPLGGLIDWDASRGDCNTRSQIAGIYKAMLAAAAMPEGQSQ